MKTEITGSIRIECLEGPLRLIIVFPDGNLAVCDENGEQVPELQGPIWERLGELKELKKDAKVDRAKIASLKKQLAMGKQAEYFAFVAGYQICSELPGHVGQDFVRASDEFEEWKRKAGVEDA